MSAPVWKIGDSCLVMGWNDWPVCYGTIESIAQLPADPTDKYYGVRALTPVLDWSQSAGAGYVYWPTRNVGESFNAHYSELRPTHPPPHMREVVSVGNEE